MRELEKLAGVAWRGEGKSADASSGGVVPRLKFCDKFEFKIIIL